MRAISMKCPNCGAGLQAQEAAHTISCNYCGTTSRIQHRTRYLKRKVEMPPPPLAAQRMPVARQVRGLGWIVSMTAFFPLLLGGGIFYVVMKKTGNLSKIGAALSKAADVVTGDRMLYSGQGNALLFDVNGDGQSDVISPVRYVQHDDSYHLAAFDGKSGDKLWQSESFGTNDDVVAGTTALHAGVVVQSDSRGNISGFSASDGARRFKVSLGEKLKTLCANSSSTVALMLANKKWKSMTLDTGAFAPLDGRPDGCARVATYTEHGQIDVEYAGDSRSSRRKRDVSIDGMNVRETVALLRKPGRFIALGYKTPGTRIPMIALFHDASLDVRDDIEVEEAPKEKKRRGKRSKRKSQGPSYVVDWASELPGLDPLSVQEGAPDFAVANDQCVASLYEPKSGRPHVVCFSTEGGQRLWDSQLPERTTYVLRALDISGDRVYVGQWSELNAFDITTGKSVFKLGY